MVDQKDCIRIVGSQPSWVGNQHAPARPIGIPIHQQVFSRIEHLASELRLQGRPQMRRHALSYELWRVRILPLLLLEALGGFDSEEAQCVAAHDRRASVLCEAVALAHERADPLPCRLAWPLPASSR